MSAAYDPVDAARWRTQLTSNGAHDFEEDLARPEFPLEVLPEPMRVYVEQIASSFPVPNEMVAVPMLAMAGSLIGNRAHLQLYPSWREYPTLWFVVVASSGSAKTPAMSAALWPLQALQKDAKKRYDQEKATYEEEMTKFRATPAKERGESPRSPRMRDYFTTDVTMESLVDILDRDPGVLISGDEIAGWVERMDQYRKGGDRQHYMSIHSGVPVKVNRKGSGFVYAQQPVVCVVGGVQPDIVPRLKGTEAGEDGFIFRVLPFVPTLQAKRWNRNAKRDASYGDIADFFRRLDRLERTETPEGHMGMAITMSRGAEDSWELWTNDNSEKTLQIGGVFGGFYAKLESHVARLALVLHVLNNLDNPGLMISQNTMDGAIELGEWFRSQIDVFAPMLGTGAIPTGVHGGLRSRIRRQLGKIRCLDDSMGTPWEWMSHSQLLQGLWRVKTEELTKELNTLIDLGEIESRPMDSATRPGTEYRLIVISPQGDHRIIQTSHYPQGIPPQRDPLNIKTSNYQPGNSEPEPAQPFNGRVPWEEEEV